MSKHTINIQTVTDGISQRVTSGQKYTTLILVDHEERSVKHIKTSCLPYIRF